MSRLRRHPSYNFEPGCACLALGFGCMLKVLPPISAGLFGFGPAGGIAAPDTLGGAPSVEAAGADPLPQPNKPAAIPAAAQIIQARFNTATTDRFERS